MATTQESQSPDPRSRKSDTYELEEHQHHGQENDQAHLESDPGAPKGINNRRPLASDHHEDTGSTGKVTPAPLANGVQTADEPDANIVDWDGPDDPANPQNWSPLKKWGNIVVLAIITFNVPLASTMFAPGVPQLLEDFNTHSESLATFVVSVYILGLAVGPLALAPMSELYGRVMIYHVGNVLFIIFTVGCALSTSLDMLIAFRFLAGLVGAGPITIGGGSIVDLTTIQQRGTAMSIWSLGPLMGPSIGPIAGGFLAQAEGWRWIFWVLTITAGVITIMGFAVLRETHPPTLLKRKTRRLQKETGNTQLRSKLDSNIAPRQLFLRSILRPSKLLIFSPVCLLLSVYAAFIYAMIYFMFSTFSFVFQDHYGFGQGTTGLVYIALGIGMMLGLVVQQATGDRILRNLAEKHNNGKPKPEYRLPIMMLGGILIPSGLFIYGWTAQKHIQWAVPLLGTLVVGAGVCIININVNLYLVDAYTIYAASALGASTVLRSVFGATFPLFALQLFNSLGLGWGNSLLGFVALGMWPIPPLFIKYGEYLRTSPKFQVKL
ncbi:major facilitator superfamily transporter [Ilyonectria robusta]|uniref:major facilitator superfamily transporter n=1 Tax=Ilyonectria robusta TaxID=1079257 RepID=UPI001E8D6D75|nr:major facilitator superfamily transporter [Ilyonectria robusta]KAH8721625.1 major facilitator superfamily transporter [Ilyonectria robusta]